MKNPNQIPCLHHEGVRIEIVDEVMYLGNMFNEKGNNNGSKIVDRVNKAKTCMIESLSLCSEITIGVYILQSLLMTHDMMFIPTLLYGAQTWTNLTVADEKQLKTIQLKFLKRIMRVPSSACNAIIYLELGVLPVSFEIHIMKLMFLHHILTLEDDDPVKRTYQEQSTIPEEKNWAKEVSELRLKYEIDEGEEEIAGLSKEQWKDKVHSKVKPSAIVQLNMEKNKLSKSSTYPDVKTFEAAEYISKLNVSNACLLFRVRSRIIDVKEFHGYKYKSDQVCRCCGLYEETLAHVWSECPNLETDPCRENDEFSEDLKVLEKIILRINEFTMKIDAEEDGDTEE